MLTGGKSPGRAYELAAERQPDWSRATLWWGDERCVPPDDERSNFRLAREKLLDKVAVQPRELHRIRGEAGAEAAAAEYDSELEGASLDLVLLGIGPDGHTASLFPGQPTLEERERRAIPAEATMEPFVERVTLTLPVLCSAPRSSSWSQARARRTRSSGPSAVLRAPRRLRASFVRRPGERA